MATSMFRASEILEMAIRIEKQGIDFYTSCLEAELDEKVADVFRYLIEQEHHHINTFKTMREDLEDYELPESYAGETGGYMDSFVNEAIFFSPKEASEKVKSLSDPLQAIDFGIRFENRSINFYEEMKEIVPESEGEKIDGVIEQERRHIERLESLREEVEKE